MNLDTVKSKLADLGHTALDTMEESYNDGRHALADTTQSVGKDVSKAATRTVSGIRHSDTVRMLGNIATAITSARLFIAAVTPQRTLHWALSSMGLQRRPSMVYRIAAGTGLVVGGAVVGAGIALLLSPKSGPQNRALLAKGFETFRTEAETTVKSIESKAEDVVHDVESKAQDVAHDVEERARSVGGSSASSTNESVASPVGGASSHRKHHTGLSHRSPKV